MDTTDAELIGRFQHGDREAFGQLVARWENRAYALAYRLTLDHDASEDIRQAAFLRAHEGLGDFNGQATFSTWFYRVVLNLCHDRRRQLRAHDAALLRLPGTQVNAGRDPATPESPCVEAEEHRRIARAVGALPDDVRVVVIMRHYEGLRFARIAEILDAPVSTVKSRMAQGLRLLRSRLEDIRS